jgi:tRNA-2-methylthio-N6-dimethylallyladenosine synthase
MVGFPGETFDDFEYTLDIIKSVRFHNLYSFKYSDRKGTAAANMDAKVDEKEKGRRLQILQDLQGKITLEKHQELEGKVLGVLVDGISKKGGQLTGRTDSNIAVNFNSNNKELGRIVKVKIQKGFAHSLQGELVP